MKWLCCVLTAAFLSTVANAQSRFIPSNDGSEITDSQTGLTWKRCSEGMSWNGTTCVGLVSAFTYDEALSHARMQAGWRVPDAKELASIVDRSRGNPAIDIMAFPATQSNWYWSSSPFANAAGSAWFVFFTNGLVHYGNRRGSYALRLVR